MVVPLFELVLSSLRTYRFLFQAFFWKKFRPGCVYLAAVEEDQNSGVLQYKAFQETFSKECFRPLDWIMVVLMCVYAVILIIFIVVYIVKIRPKYQLALKEMTPDNLLGDYKKLPHEMNKFIVKPVVEPVTKNVTKILPKSNRTSKKSEKKKKNSTEEVKMLEQEKVAETSITPTGDKIPEYV